MAYELGGRADKYGNRFEINWTIRKLLEVIEEKIESVTIEALGLDEKGADLWIRYKDGRRESQQCKGRNASLEYWDFGTLSSKNIWKTWAFQLERSSSVSVALVSPLNCTTLEDICNRARTNGQDPILFYKEQIMNSGKETKTFFGNVCQAFGLDLKNESDLKKALSFFSRMHMRQVTDGEMKNEILAKISNLFVGEAEAIYSILVDYILNGGVYGETLNTATLGKYLKKQNVEYRNLSRDARIWPAITRLNNEYRQVFKPFSCGYIERKEADICFDFIRDGASVVLHGNAGTGKSGCIENLIARLNEESITYVAIKLDRYVPSGNSEMWANKLGLPASISFCLNAVAPDQNAVLVLDQLDALRWTQAHSNESLMICTQIISEVRQLNKEREKPISLVFVCRTYDLDNDSFISSLFTDESDWKKVSIGLLKDSELKKVLGASFDKVSLRTRNLLKIPSNLYIWEKLDKSQNHLKLTTTHQLIRTWWEQLTCLCNSKNLSSSNLEEYRERLVRYCYEYSKLNMPKYLLSIPGDYENFLVSSGFLVVEKNLISFVHQSILDCFFAEEMFKEYIDGKSILSIIGEKQNQTPAKRYQFVIFMQQLADIDEDKFISSGMELLASDSIRYSFKYVFIEVMSQVPCSENVKRCICNLLDDSSWRDCILYTIVLGSHEYIHLLRKNGKLSELLKTVEGTEIVINLFHSIRTFIDDEDVAFISERINEENSEQWAWIFAGEIGEDTDSLFRLRMLFYNNYPNLLERFIDLKRLMQKNEIRAIQILAKMLEENVRRSSRSQYGDSEGLISSEMDLFVTNYMLVLETFIPLFPAADESIAFSNWTSKHSFHNGVERTCVLLVKLASEAFALNNPDEYLDYYKFAYEKANTLYNEIILDSLFFIDNSYADYVLNYISRDGFINAFEDSSNNGNELLLAKKCISKFTEFCSDEALIQFEQRVIKYNYPDALRYLKRRIEVNEERRMKKEPTVYWNYWGDLQFELLPAIHEGRRSKEVNDLIRVLNRRNINRTSVYDYEEDNRTYSVVSPVSRKELSVQNWIGILTNGKIGINGKTVFKQKEEICIENSLMEFAHSFSKFVSDNPREAAQAVLSLGDFKVHDVFIDALFNGIATSNKIDTMEEDLLADLIHLFKYDYVSNRAADIADAIKEVTIDRQMDYFVDVLIDIIENHTNPEEGESDSISDKAEEDGKVSSIEIYAINCVRGGAIRALSSLVREDRRIFENNKEAISRLVEDKNIYVRYALLSLLFPIIEYDEQWAKSRILNLFIRDYRLAGYVYSRHLFCRSYKEYADDIIGIVRNMFHSKDARLIQTAGYSISELYMLAGFFNDIKDIYISSSKEQRRALLEMIIVYFAIPEYRERAKDLLESIILIEDDEDNEFLWGRLFKDKLLDVVQDREIIGHILKSKIKRNILGYFFEYVSAKRVLKQFADVIFDLCFNALERPDEYSDIFGIDTELSKMTLSLYDEASSGKDPDDAIIALKCLDVWDKMYEKNVGIARRLTEQLLDA